MTRKELKEIVGQLITKNRTKEAIDKIIEWAKENNQEQLKKEATLIKGALNELNSEKRIGVLSNSEASVRQNKINYSVLGLLDDIEEDSPIQDNAEEDVKSGKIKILMLTSNPAKTTKLNLDKEYTDINRKLQQKQELYNIILEKAVSGTEFKEFTQRERPSILHFSGHGAEGDYAGIIVQNDDKNGEALIPVKGLRALFKLFKKRLNIKVVLLNACYTQEQAATISEYVDYVIGTNVDIGDVAASAFSSGFYFQLAKDEQMNVEDAFDSGRTEAVMKGADEDNFVIYRKGELITID